MDRDLIQQAKDSLGDRAAEIIAKGLNVSRWDSKNLKGCCPFHNENTPSFIWHKKKNHFKCFGCGATIDIIDFYQQSGMNFVESTKALFELAGIMYDFEEDLGPAKNKNNQPYRYPVEEKKAETPVEKYLGTRKISQRTIKYADVKQDDDGNIAFEYRNQYGELMMVKYRPSRKLQKKDIKTWCQKDKDTAPLLYGMEKIDTTKPLLICEGEIDRLSAIESGFYNAVSIPFGAGNFHWIEYNWEWLEQFEKIIIWSDMDDAGEKMRREVIPRLGEYRCYTVTIPDRYQTVQYNNKTMRIKDVNEVLFFYGPQAVLELIQNAKEVPIKDVIDLADVEDFDINKAEKIPSGIKGLDRYIHGFVLGTVDIITGINGSGKSTYIDQVCICEPLEAGYKTFIFSGELTIPQLRSWIEYPMAGPNAIQEIDNGPDLPRGYYIPKEIKSKMRDWYRGKIFIYDNDQDQTAASILKKMEEMARRYGVKNFVLDNLMMMDLECSEYEVLRKQTDFVKSLVRFATRYMAVVHLVAHPRKTERIQRLSKLDVSGSGNITNLAHYVTAIHRVTPDEKIDKYNKKGELIEEGCQWDCVIDLFKNRPLGHQDKSIGVLFEPKSKRFYGTQDDPKKQYSWAKVQIAGFDFLQLFVDTDNPFGEGGGE